MKDSSGNRFGGVLSLLLGCSYLLIGISYFLQPPELQEGGNTAFDTFAQAFGRNPTPHILFHLAVGLSAISGLGVVPAISALVQHKHEGWVRWTANLAYLGFAVLAIDNFEHVSLQATAIEAYLKADPITKKVATELAAPNSLDPQGWFGYGGVGLWVLVVSLLMRQADIGPRPLPYIGFATTALYWCIVLGSVLKSPVLIMISAGLGGLVLAPLWYIWMGLTLRRSPLSIAVSQQPIAG